MNIRSSESPLSSSSPPPPPPPPPPSLPVSYGPGNRRYSFSISSAPSPSPSAHTSLPFLKQRKKSGGPNVQKPAAPFSFESQELESKRSTCLQDLLEWFAQRCCNCCARLL